MKDKIIEDITFIIIIYIIFFVFALLARYWMHIPLTSKMVVLLPLIIDISLLIIIKIVRIFKKEE
ncbi:MAG: hypothetical protein IJ565_06520 [Bacilli bacterium]|nr:hypothetical protein [Bacilli bacterium]